MDKQKFKINCAIFVGACAVYAVTYFASYQFGMWISNRLYKKYTEHK